MDEPQTPLPDLLTELPPPDPDRPFLAGTFALYSDSDGSVVIVTDIEGRGIERQTIPKAMVKAAINFASGGGVLGKLGGFIGRGKGGNG